MDSLRNLRAFVETARTGSFSEAARRLGVAPSVVMKRVNQVEAEAAAPLLRRTTRQVSLTDAGRRHLPAIQALLGEADAVLATLRRPEADVEGHIRIGAPPALTHACLAALLARFLAEHPRLTLEITLIDRAVDPAESGIDVVVGAFTRSFDGVVDIPLCRMRRVAVAAPEYLARHGAPRHPRDLAHHACLSFMPSGLTWSFRRGRRLINVEVRPKLSASDSQILAIAAAAGSGIAVLPSYAALPAIRAGLLRPVLETFPITDLWIKASVAGRQSELPRIRRLVDFLGAQMAPIPPWERQIEP